jgi:hypothetical protein
MSIITTDLSKDAAKPKEVDHKIGVIKSRLERTKILVLEKLKPQIDQPFLDIKLLKNSMFYDEFKPSGYIYKLPKLHRKLMGTFPPNHKLSELDSALDEGDLSKILKVYDLTEYEEISEILHELVEKMNLAESLQPIRPTRTLEIKQEDFKFELTRDQRQYDIRICQQQIMDQEEYIENYKIWCINFYEREEEYQARLKLLERTVKCQS